VNVRPGIDRSIARLAVGVLLIGYTWLAFWVWHLCMGPLSAQVHPWWEFPLIFTLGATWARLAWHVVEVFAFTAWSK
jgi:hypothetical protein